MTDPDKATETQLKNIQQKTGKSLDELSALVAASGLTKHGEIRTMLMDELGLSYGDANALAHAVLQSDGTRAAQAAGATADDVVDSFYTGPKAALRPIHDKLMAAINGFGAFETLPKKGYVSLRRKRQFAMLGPTTNTRVELGLNAKALPLDDRLLAQPAGSMCNYIVRLTDPAQVTDEVIAWARAAYDGAG
jgi:hypothetical protein